MCRVSEFAGAALGVPSMVRNPAGKKAVGGPKIHLSRVCPDYEEFAEFACMGFFMTADPKLVGYVAGAPVGNPQT